MTTEKKHKSLRQERNAKTLYTVTAILVIGVAGYFGFKPLFGVFTDGAIQEFISAIFATVFTVVLTMFLLNKQTELEEDREMNSNIFQKKLEIYEDFLALLQDVCMDEKIQANDPNGDEIKKLIFMYGRMRVVSNLQTIKEISDEIRELFDPEIQGNFNQILVDKLIKVVAHLRAELFPYDQAPDNEMELNNNISVNTMLDIKEEEVVEETSATGATQSGGAGQGKTIFYANLSIANRNYEDMFRFGYWQAGGSARIVKGVKRMRKGDILYAYASGFGYMGIGEVQQEAVHMTKFTTEDGKLLSDSAVKTSERTKEILAPENQRSNNNKEKGEYVVPVKWLKTADKLESAIREDGMFASPMTSCRLNDQNTMEKVNEALGYDSAS